MQELVTKLNAMCDAQPYKVSWYLKNLRTGESGNRNGDEIVGSRSTRKVSIMMSLLKAVNEGKFDLSKPVTIHEKYRDTKSGVTQFMLPNLVIPLHDAMLLMIIVSDNPSTATIVDMLGKDYINDYCKSIGMKNTIHRFSLPVWVNDLNVNTVITANDQGLILEKIVKGCDSEAAAKELGCTTDLCRLAIKVMQSQRLRNSIPLLLPEGTVTATKGGSGPGMSSDTGIVYDENGPLYILTVYCWDVPSELEGGVPGPTGAHQFIGAMAKTAWNELRK